MIEKVSLHIIVHGRVQGVNYRVFTQRQANYLNLEGYVRNLPDRSVEVYAEGDHQQLEQLLENLKKGPPAARVDIIETVWAEYSGKFQGFTIIR